jgi:4-hydroxybenzoate polyprenyltransferase
LTTTVAIAAPSAPTRQERPLCVDLDGTLVKSDTLLDGLFQFLRRRPLQFWRLPVWLLKGKAHLKTEVGRAAPLDAARLPYNTKLLHFLQAERRDGREIYLATGADGALATRVAQHLGIFAGVLATDRSFNLTRTHKLDRLQERFGAFDYIGNSRADLPLLTYAGQAMLANPTPALRMAIRLRHIPVAQTFVDNRPLGRTMFKAIRLHQWAKNILLFVPLLLSHQLSARALVAAGAAFLCFSFMASANYLINDLLDIESDRRHPSKRHRPFASGNLSVAAGIGLALALFAGSLAILPLLPAAFAFWVGIYIAVTLAYSVYLKRLAAIDVLVLSGLYTLRMLAGGAATGTEISHWLGGFSTFLFLSLAMVKRFSELENLRERGAVSTHGRGYLVTDLEQIRSFGTASGYAAVVVFMLYIARPDVTDLYRYAGRLWLLVPLLLYWITRIWLLASRGELDDDPVIFAIRDPMSLVVGLGILAVAWLAI